MKRETPISIASRPRTCSACAHRLRRGTCAEPVAACLAEAFAICWAPEGHAQSYKAFSPIALVATSPTSNSTPGAGPAVAS